MLGDAPAVEPAAPAARQVAGLLVERGRAVPVLEDARLGPGRDPLAEPFDSGRDQRRLDELAREMVEILEEQALAGVGKDAIRVAEDPVDPAEVVAEPRRRGPALDALRVPERRQEVGLVVA